MDFGAPRPRGGPARRLRGAAPGASAPAARAGVDRRPRDRRRHRFRLARRARQPRAHHRHPDPRRSGPPAAVDADRRAAAGPQRRGARARTARRPGRLRDPRRRFGQALVLVNGARLNDAQSGHHNGDIPVSLLDVERIEVLLGGGASVHGADAVGGAVNVITRRAGPRFASDIAFGQHDLVEAAAAVSLAARPVEHVFSGEFNRSTGFAPRSRSRRQAGPLSGHDRRRGRRCRWPTWTRSSAPPGSTARRRRANGPIRRS